MSIITSIISSVVVTIIMVIITTITSVKPVVAVIATVVIASVIAAVVAMIITSIPIVVVGIGPTIMVILSIGSTVTIVEALAAVAIVVVSSGLLGGRRNSKGTLQLLALPRGVLGVTMELALVVHDHIEVTFEEGGRSWWICYIGFAGSLARPGASIIVVFSVEVMHYRILRVDSLSTYAMSSPMAFASA
jgi:hypothetical protein